MRPFSALSFSPVLKAGFLLFPLLGHGVPADGKACDRLTFINKVTKLSESGRIFV
jgi:hypothetical protein